MFIINKILKPRFLLVLLVLGGGALFTVLQATSNRCVSTANGDLTEQTTFGTYQGSAQAGCGSDLTLDYLINSGTTVNWDGSSGPLQGEMEIESGGTLRVEGDVSLNSASSFQNSGTLDSGSYNYTAIRNDNTEITTIAGRLENYADGIGEEGEFSYLNQIIRIGTNIYVIDGLRIRVLNPATGALSTIQTSGESFDWIERLTTDGTNIYFTSYVSNVNKLFKLSVADGVVSELQTSGGSDNSSDNSSSSSNIIGLASDGTDLFVARYSYGSGTSGMQVSRIALQTGTVTSYTTTTGGESLSYMSGMEKIGDSLFASSSSSIYEIELSGTSATVGKLSLSGIDNSTSVYFDKMTSSGNSLYLSGNSPNSPMYRVNLVEGDNSTTTGEATAIEPSFTAASYYNTGTEVTLNYVGSLASDGTALYVADGSHNLIRKIDLTTSNI
ncbi:MAG: hypothetical protein QF825_10630, partial [SAR324 cluster bacterium]|nr:hypothetical protein [SAR324 cluster bacterium]